MATYDLWESEWRLIEPSLPPGGWHVSTTGFLARCYDGYWRHHDPGAHSE
jgi:hypothetical protein